MLNILEQFPVREWGFHSPRTLHALIEAKKLAYADLLRYIGDPRFSRAPVQQLLSKENAAARARLIDPKKAAATSSPRSFPASPPRGKRHHLPERGGRRSEHRLADSKQLRCFGSGLTPAGAGFMLQNRGNLFTFRPGQPNTIAGRKRRSTPSFRPSCRRTPEDRVRIMGG